VHGAEEGTKSLNKNIQRDGEVGIGNKPIMATWLNEAAHQRDIV
jgi:hypothetical protein